MAEQKKNSVEELLNKMPKKKADEIRELISKAITAIREREQKETEQERELSEKDKQLSDMIKRERNIPRITLESLLAGVTEDNIHLETDTGVPVGNEVW